MSPAYDRSLGAAVCIVVLAASRGSLASLATAVVVLAGTGVSWLVLDVGLTAWIETLGVPRRRLVRPLAVSSPAAWSVLQTRSIWEAASTTTSTFPNDPLLDSSLSTLLSLIIQHHVLKWYAPISSSRSFPNAVEQSMRDSLVNIVSRVDKIDWSDFIVGRVVTLVTDHVEAFRTAEYALRGLDLKNPLTESDELDLFFAARYAAEAKSKLHAAVDVTSPHSKSSEEAWLSDLMERILSLVMPEREVASKAVLIMTREIVACAVMLPIIDRLSDPDFWNQLIEQKAGAAIRDQRMVSQFREALDKQGSAIASASYSKLHRHPLHRTQEISASTSARHFEAFVKGIRKCNNLLDARRLRSDLASHIRKTKVLLADLSRENINGGEKGSQLLGHVERLSRAKQTVDKKIADLGGGTSSHRQSIASDLTLPGYQVRLRDILLSPTSLSYFMEYQDRRRRSLLVQFWLLVESLKDPLEDVDSSSDDDNVDNDVRRPELSTATSALSDMKMVWTTYFSSPSNTSNRKYVRTIREFAETANANLVTTVGLRRVRRAIFAAQEDVLKEMEDDDYPGFEKTELYFKALSTLSTSIRPSAATLSDSMVSTASLPPESRHSPPDESVATSSLRLVAQLPFSLSRSSSPSTISLPSLSTQADFLSPRSGLAPKLSISSFPIPGSGFPATTTILTSPFASTGSGLGIDLSRRRAVNPSLSNSLEFLMSSPAEKREKRTPLFSEPLFAEDDDQDRDESGYEGCEAARREDAGPEISDDEYVQVQTIEAIQEALCSILATDAIGSTANLSYTAQEITHFPSPDMTSRSFSDARRTRLVKRTTTPIASTSSLLVTSDVRLRDDGPLSDQSGPSSSCDADADNDGDEEYQSSLPTAMFDTSDIRLARPGDLHLPLEIERITQMIDKLGRQEAVVVTMMNKAELTGIASELKILSKSQDSLLRELRKLRFQKSQYEEQETQNQLVPGRTSVTISGTTVGQANNQSFQLYLVEVHQLALDSSFTSGWIVTRRYSEFDKLHSRLKEKFALAVDLPGKSLVERYADTFIEQRKLGLEKYLKALVRIPVICESSELRTFLSQQNISLPRIGDSLKKPPGSAFLGHGVVRSFYRSVTSGIDDLLTGSSTSSMMDTVIQRLSQQANDISSVNSNGLINDDDLVVKSAIGVSSNDRGVAFSNATRGVKEGLSYFTGPICDLFVTLFELKDKNNWLRRQAILIILQQVLGGTIERKFRDAVAQALSPVQITTYIQLFQDTLFPDGDLKRPSPTRTPLERSETRESARIALLDVMPVIGASLIGRRNAKQGARRIFATLQNRKLNRHLIYSILKEVTDVLFPEIRQGEAKGVASI